MKLSVRNKISGWASLWRLYMVSVLILLFFLRLALPQYIKYLLFPLLAISGVISFIVFIKYINQEYIKEFNFSIFLPLGLISLLYLIAFIFTSEKQIMLIRDFVNVLSVFTFLIIILFIIRSEKELSSVISIFSAFAVIASTIVAILGLIKLYYQLMGTEFNFLRVEGIGYPEAASLSIDNNFYTLVCLFGIIFILPSLFKRKPIITSVVSQLSLLILFTNIFFSTSRRGVIIASAVLVGFITIWIISYIKKSEQLKQFLRNSLGFGFASFLSISIVVYLLICVSPLERNKRLSFSRFDQGEVHLFVNYMTLSIRSIFKGDIEYQDINRNIWEANFDPRYPFSGWASGNYTPVISITGENAEIIPAGVVGAMIDKNTGSSIWNENAYYYSKLFEKKEDSRKRYLASVYCYVSPEFNGDRIRLSSHGDVTGFTTSYYNMKQKGKWQKLETSFYADSGNFKTYLNFLKLNSLSLDNLNGYMVFAYPDLKEISFDPKSPITWAGAQFNEISPLPSINAGIIPDSSSGFSFNPVAFITRDSLKYAVSNLFILDRNNINTRSLVSIYVYISEDFNGDQVYLSTSGNYTGLGISKYNMNDKGKWQKLLLSLAPEDVSVNVNFYVKKIITNDSDTLIGDVLFAFPGIKEIEFDPHNPLSWAARKYKEVKNLPGKNSEIVPENSIGYLIDNESDFFLSKSSVKYINSTNFGKRYIVSGKRYVSSVFCYVSRDFNGDRVRFGTQGMVYGSRSDFYNLNKKGIWQKLFLNNYGDSSYIAPSVVFEIPEQKEVKCLSGYVILAYPEFNVMDYSPENPNSYTSTDFKRIYPLTGRNSYIVPDGIAGCQFGKTANGIVINNVCQSITRFNNISVAAGDSVYASVFCYVSTEFDGNEVRLQYSGNIIGSLVSKYDLLNKGRWINLELRGKTTEEGRIIGILYFSKKDVLDFSTLKGYVTFAYPVIKVIKSGEKELSYDLQDYNKNSKSVIRTTFFPFLQDLMDSSLYDQDSLIIIPEFQKEMINDIFAGPRLDRWRYAMYLYKNEYNNIQKLIGDGFGFTRKFAFMFFYVDTDYDYPHNPILSVLLYSGIIGLIIYIWFIIKAFYYYWIYRKKYWTIGLCFLIGIFFSFFSANNPFEPAIVGVLTILPYIIHYNHLKGTEPSVNLEKEEK